MTRNTRRGGSRKKNTRQAGSRKQPPITPPKQAYLAQIGLKRRHDPRGGVPGVGMGSSLLGLAQVLVIRQDVGQRGRHCGVQAGVGRDLQGRRVGNVDAHVLLTHTTGRRGDPIHHQPAGIVVRRG